MTGPKNICVGGYDQEGPKHAKREVCCLGRLPYKYSGFVLLTVLNPKMTIIGVIVSGTF